MVWLWIILILVALLIGFLLLPVRLKVDTSENHYELDIPGIFRCQVVPDEEEFILIKLRILFYKMTIHPLRMSGKSRKKKPGKKRRKSGRKSRMKWATVRKLLASFKVKHLEIDIDTNDAIANGLLTPLFIVLNRGRHRWHINWEERQLVKFELENRPIRVLWAIIKP
jgi:hypothetical protein